MILKIATTEIVVKDCYAYEHANGKRELKIQIPQTSISYEELKALLKGDTSEIVLTKDDGTTKTFCGYKTTFEITDKTEKGIEIFQVIMPCVAEAERRALEAQAQVVTLEKKVVEQAETMSKQSMMVDSLSQQLLITQLAAAELYEKSLTAEPCEKDLAADDDYSGSQYAVDDEEAAANQEEIETEPVPEDEQEVQ